MSLAALLMLQNYLYTISLLFEAFYSVQLNFRTF